ncbi:MAG: universal stress protein [Candidatus Rokubacteria bacterium]|nr:universal stress protein [Candidatus Rokubacteria bacterium]
MSGEGGGIVRQILFATDFSDSSEVAGRVARDYARHFGARLHALHVVWPGADATGSPLLDKLAAELRAEVPVVAAVESGAPAARIVSYAERHGIDLIVLGTHGRTGVTRALLGSVAERVVRTAPCPVLTVPRARRAPDPLREAEPPSSLRRCLVCVTPSEDLICAACRARIRGEALERKLREERAGRA